MENDGITDAPHAVTPQPQQNKKPKPKQSKSQSQSQSQKRQLDDPSTGTTSSTGSTSPTRKRRKVNHGTLSYLATASMGSAMNSSCFLSGYALTHAALEQPAFTVGGL